MSSYARFQLQAAGGVAFLYLGFLIWMLDGATLGSRTPEVMGWLVGGAIIVCAVLLGGLWVAYLRNDGARTLADEREEQIEAQAERNASRALEAAVFGLVVLALTDAQWAWMGSFALSRTEGLVFALCTVSAFTAILRFATGFRGALRL